MREAMHYLDLDYEEALHQLILNSMAEGRPSGRWQDIWFDYPVQTKMEVGKSLTHLTHFDDDDPDEIARLVRQSSILPTDRFFLQVRRRLSLLERPITSASAEGRRWTGKAPYNPFMAIKCLEILRTYYNYADLGKSHRETPAMKIGLARAPLELRAILKPKS